MKKLICTVICTAMLSVMAACGGGKTADSSAEVPTAPAEAPTEAAASAPAPTEESVAVESREEASRDETPDQSAEAGRDDEDKAADDAALIEEDQGWQNPVMNFVGEYWCDRAHALVECSGKEDAAITIEWAGSVSEYARWDIIGPLDLDTMTVKYSGCTKSHVVYNENGEIVSQEPEYEDGTGTITFNDNGTFTWHEDQSEQGYDMVFEWSYDSGD